MRDYREGLPERPQRIKNLPLDERGYPVPYFVTWIDGKPDFRVADPGKIAACWKHELCWICGAKLGRFISFVIGPMCSINRISAEPPVHHDCGVYAAQACPFLAIPSAQRRKAGLPEDYVKPSGIMLEHNPGVTLVWTSKRHPKRGPHPVRVRGGQDGSVAGYVFHIGEPVALRWFTQGRPASRSEVNAAITRGLPHLVEPAERQGADAVRALDDAVEAMEALLDGPLAIYGASSGGSPESAAPVA